MALKQNTANWVEIFLETSLGAPATGLAFNDASLSFLLHKAGGAVAAFVVPSAGAWKETGLGFYMVQLAVGDCDTVGRLAFVGKVTGGPAYAANEIVDAQLPSDVFSRLGAPAGASIAADVAAVKVDTAAVKVKTDGLPADPADASDIAASFTTVNGTLATIAGFVDTEVAAIKAKTDNLPALPASQSDVTTVGTAVAAVSTKLGAPAGASVSADIAAVSAKTTNLPSDPADQSLVIAATDAVMARLGAPAGASMSADIAALTTGVSATNAMLAVLHGLMGANSFEDTFVYDGPAGALGSSRLRTYDSAANAAAHGLTGLLKTYAFTFGYTGSSLTSVGIAET